MVTLVNWFSFEQLWFLLATLAARVANN